MHADFWHDLWDKKQIGFHMPKANPILIEFLPMLDLQPESRIFLPLCGKTLDIAWLLSKGHRVVGAELNEGAIQELFEDLGVVPNVDQVGNFKYYSALNLDIYVGDVFELDAGILGSVDAVYDRAALVALPKNMRVNYAKHLVDITQAAPQLLINFEFELGSAKTTPPFSIMQEEIYEHYKSVYEIKLLENYKVEAKEFANINAYEKVWLLSNNSA